MSEIAKLDPQIVWDIFDQITKVPRPSKKEGKIIAYLEQFAQEHKLEYRKDNAGNIVILRPASPTMTDRPTVILQSHVDMVCEKNSDVKFDFDKDAIRTYIEDGWVKARGTTLGADDGIGMAAALAVLIIEGEELPAIEALFTVDEETGLTGAFELGRDMLTGKYLINRDSEDEGEVFIGCAGGIDTLATFTYQAQPAPEKHAFFRVDIRGLKGGHSGDDIEKGRANSNKLMARLLLNAEKDAEIKLAIFDGGNLRNAIPREAYAVIGVPVKLTTRFLETYEKTSADARAGFATTEPDMEFSV